MLALSLLLLCGFSNLVSSDGPVDVFSQIVLKELEYGLNWYNKTHPNDTITCFRPETGTAQQNLSTHIYKFRGELTLRSHPNAVCDVVVTVHENIFKKWTYTMTYSC